MGQPKRQAIALKSRAQERVPLNQSCPQSSSQSCPQSCQHCHYPRISISDRFCQNCGRSISLDRAVDRAADRALRSDQAECVRSPQLAGITNRGLWHPKNEDAIAIECLGNGRQLMVVCDGVSSSVNPETASQVAAQTTAQALQQTPHQQNPYEAIESAIHQAQVAVSSLAPVAPDNPPSTTIVAALVEPNQPQPTATIGWIGDSRAYWVSPTETKLLTEDDSWLNWIRNHGQPPNQSIFDHPGDHKASTSHDHSHDHSHSHSRDQNLEDFAKSPYANAITRWLGAQKSQDDPTKATNPTPSIVQVPLDQEGFLILCSDGLWNYASQPDRLFNVFSGHTEEDALTIAQDLVNHALRCGGRDNVSVAVFHQSSR